MTDTVIHSYCPDCEGGGIYTPEARILTTYTTVYSQFCSTGSKYLEEITYTVTESCSSLDQPRSANYVPQGFTVTTATCHVCAETPVVATLTAPLSIAPSPGPSGAPVPVPAVPTSPPSGYVPPTGVVPPPDNAPLVGGSPAAAGHPGAAPPVGAAPAGTTPSSGESASQEYPGALSPASGGSSPAGNAAPAAGGAASAPIYPTSQGRTGVLPTGAPASGSGSPVTGVAPFAGAAVSLSCAGSVFIGLFGMIGAMAYVL